MRWEYLTMRVETGFSAEKAPTDDLDKKLETVGKEGWELSSHFSILSDGDTRAVLLIFKRPLRPD